MSGVDLRAVEMVTAYVHDDHALASSLMAEVIVNGSDDDLIVVVSSLVALVAAILEACPALEDLPTAIERWQEWTTVVAKVKGERA